jgi:hypothetical protein
MAAAGTLLADLDSQSGGGDGDLVQKILSDMNIPSAPVSQQQRPAPPPLPAQTPVYQQQMASSTAQLSMDSRIPTSHMIGNEHPSPADFAAAMASPPQAQMYGQPMANPYGQQMANPYGQPMPGMPGMPGMPQGSQDVSKNLYGRVLDEMKVPFIVALLFFVFSLPPIRVLVSHYMPSFVKSTGEFQTTGLLAVSLLVGASFWVLQRVIAPLLSL